MELEERPAILKESIKMPSLFLDRVVRVDFYLPTHVVQPSQMNLLLINDGQDLEALGWEAMIGQWGVQMRSKPLLSVGIHAGPERKMEYGTAHMADYKGRGAKARLYSRFVLEELIPHIRDNYQVPAFSEIAFAGFSLGGLSALDIAWNHPGVFSRVGVFSGSLWWRTKDKHDPTYDDYKDRIMHQHIRHSQHVPRLKFFFQCGGADEQADRNNNGIIDSIDDTLDLMAELEYRGFDSEEDIHYLELEDGKHDIATWAKAMPAFLQWAWGSPA